MATLRQVYIWAACRCTILIFPISQQAIPLLPRSPQLTFRQCVQHVSLASAYTPVYSPFPIHVTASSTSLASKRRRVQQHTTRTLQRDGGTNWQLQSSQEDLPLEPRVVSRTCDATVQSCTTEVLARYIARLSEQVTLTGQTAENIDALIQPTLRDVDGERIQNVFQQASLHMHIHTYIHTYIHVCTCNHIHAYTACALFLNVCEMYD